MTRILDSTEKGPDGSENIQLSENVILPEDIKKGFSNQKK